MTDYISRADAMGAVQDHFNADGFKGYDDGQKMMDRLKALPSADANGEDLIIKGAKGIQDGLYNIKDGKLFKYKAKGGTVRTYPIVPSADAEQIVYCMDCAKSEPLDEHGALWKCKAHDRTTLRHSYCNNGERKGGDDE